MAHSFARAKSRYKPQPTVLVICEDSKSGKRYLEDASLHFRANVHVQISHCGKTDPLGIVKEAIDNRKKFEQIYCVIDRDTHQNFTEALSKVKNNNSIQMIVSYPCYEFWLLLHFGPRRKPYAPAGKYSAAEQLIKDLQYYPEFTRYDKGQDMSVFVLLKDKLANARKCAPKILEEAVKSGEMNPSTRIHELLDYFEKLGEPQKR
jgi:hypothetical protein